MAKFGPGPEAIFSDDGLRLQGFLHPDGAVSDLTRQYSSLPKLYADMAAGNLVVGGYRVGKRLFGFDGYVLTEIETIGSNNWPHINLSHSVIKTFLNNQGATHTYEQHRQALEIALPPLILSTAWNKIHELWIPLGADLAGALVKLKYVSGIGNIALTNTNFISTDYSPYTGLTGDGVSKYLTSTGVNPTSLGLTNNSWGMAVHTTSKSWTSNGVLISATQNNPRLWYYAGDNSPNTISYNFNPLTIGNATNWTDYFNGTQLAAYGNSRTNWVQGSLAGFNGNTANMVTTGCGSFQMGSVIANPSNTLPAQDITLFGLMTNSIGSLSNATITGYAIFDALLPSELDVLSRFFDQINHLSYRPIFEKLVAVGDSITNGNLLSSANQRWTYLLSQKLGLQEVNYGLGGSTLTYCPNQGNNPSPNNSLYWAYDPVISSNTSSSGMLNLAFQDTGVFYILALGINDLSYSNNLTNYIQHLIQTLTQIREAGLPISHLVIVGITFASNIGGSAQNNAGFYTPALAQQWNSAIQIIALQFGCIFSNPFPLWNASNSNIYLNPDGIHPNASGHQLIANQVYNDIMTSRYGTLQNYVPSY